MPKQTPFHRIYWKPDWQRDYARLYASYVASLGNYYSQSASALLDAANLRNPAIVADIGCGTGAFSAELLKRYPGCEVFGIDISPSMLEFYRKRMKNQNVHAIEGNAEEAHRFVQRADAAFVSSAVWDMKVPALLENVGRMTDTIAFNVPYAVLGEERGLIEYVEMEFSKYGGKRYRRLPRNKLESQMKSTGWAIDEHEYSFLLSKKNLQKFFRVLRHRYPFIFFPETPYASAMRKIDRIFEEMLDEMPAEGLREEGIIFVGRK